MKTFLEFLNEASDEFAVRLTWSTKDVSELLKQAIKYKFVAKPTKEVGPDTLSQGPDYQKYIITGKRKNIIQFYKDNNLLPHTYTNPEYIVKQPVLKSKSLDSFKDEDVIAVKFYYSERWGLGVNSLSQKYKDMYSMQRNALIYNKVDIIHVDKDEFVAVGKKYRVEQLMKSMGIRKEVYKQFVLSPRKYISQLKTVPSSAYSISQKEDEELKKLNK